MTPRPSPRVRTTPPRRVPTSKHVMRFTVGSRIDRSATWDAALCIVFDLFIIGVDNVVSGFLTGTTSIASLALYLLAAMSTFVYGVFYVVIGAEMIVKAAIGRTFETAELMVEVSDGDDGGEGRDSDGDRRDGTESPMRD